ncbi:hypothetical protein MGYG_06384 [Nannizzia gypsea CBS 118893]|uniref:Uncharacterized protein n=1 Tax=Arthroderma gypseum (strain ATCC MYA-4604 / CBS 118893) TaxID=535722 RepID=E4UZ55_ARTGP|nr:hypothetical protein MGYG_06384 [Nannizzia gypsea CBS 118893]EFR03385.1 hypothetical protein MGYG_06384 [Nannizzia gypsea CBS 118893]
MTASRVLGLCTLLQALGVTHAFAPDWTITKYFEESVTTLPGNTGRYGTYPSSEYTETIPVVPTVTSPTATATVTTTVYPDITYIGLGLESGQGTSSTYDYYSNSNAYYVSLTYTYPSSCSSSESPITTSARVSIPREIQSQLTPTQTSAETASVEYLDSVSYYTSKTFLLNPTDLPSGVYSSIEAYHTPSDIEYCHYGSRSGSSGYGSSSSSGSSDIYDNYCGRGYRPKPREEQEELERNWKSMSFAAKFTLWLKYGFSRSYPPMLGAAPPLATDPLPASQPRMAQLPTVPGVMPPLPQQIGPQPLPQQTDQQAEQHLDVQPQGQQPVLQSTEQQPVATQREYEPLPAISQGGSTGLFEHPTHAVSPVNEHGSPIPPQSQLTQPYNPHEQHIHEDQPRDVPTHSTELPSGTPRNV